MLRKELIIMTEDSPHITMQWVTCYCSVPVCVCMLQHRPGRWVAYYYSVPAGVRPGRWVACLLS